MSDSFHGVEVGGEEMSEPDGGQANRERQHGIGTGSEPFTILHEREGLQAEGGKCSIAPTDADHEKDAGTGRHQPPAVRSGEGGKEANGERAGHVGDQGAPGKGFTKTLCHRAGDQVAQSAAEAAAQNCEKEVHGLCLMTRVPLAIGDL